MDSKNTETKINKTYMGNNFNNLLIYSNKNKK